MWMERTCGDLESVIDALHERVPFEGRCEFPNSKNQKLDRFRRALNVVYDLFNNGLGNRRDQWKYTMGIDVPIHTHSEVYRYNIRQDAKYWDNIEDNIAPRFRKIVMDAVLEQFGKDVWLKIMHNQSSKIINDAIKRGDITV